MLELSGTNFEKGIFELRLERPLGRWGAFWVGLGPFRGRLWALGLFLLSSLLLYFQIPAQFFMSQHYFDFYPEAARAQNWIVGALVVVGVVLYVGMLLVQQPGVTLVWDRGQQELRWRLIPALSVFPRKEGKAPLSVVQTLRVQGPQRAPQTSCGYLDIEAPSLKEASLRSLRFAFLTEDQARFYPLNLSRLTGVTPQGDWIDPGDEPMPSN